MRVLIVRLGAMGDILHALPAVTALRVAHPEWFVGWAVEPRWQALLRAESSMDEAQPELTEAMPLIDRMHLVNAKQWARAPLAQRTLADIGRIRRELGEAEYDVCVDLQGAVRSALIGRGARPRRMIGEDRPREYAARWLFTERVLTKGRHVIEQAVEVVEAIMHESLPVVAALLPCDRVAEKWCEGFLRTRVKRPFVLINPGAGWGAKRWPAERYGLVARALFAQGYGVVVNTGPDEEALAAELVSASGNGAVTVNPSLGELISLTRRASLLIAGDTGPLHLACALGKPVIGIFGPTDPERNGPFGCEFRVLRHPESQRDHSRRAEPEAGLLTISPEAVIESAFDLLRAKEQR